MVLLITEGLQGGHLWIADSAGTHNMLFQGQEVAGRIQDISKPFIFPARTVLHATQGWDEGKTDLQWLPLPLSDPLKLPLL